jgi:hypothetical protein
MLDIAFLVLIIGFFWLTWGFVRACAGLGSGLEETRK